MCLTLWPKIRNVYLMLGIKVRVLGTSGDGEKLMHNKFCIIDSTSPEGIVINGSLNWTHQVSNYELMHIFMKLE